MRLKSLQANNQGLALALEEEKRKVREAQDIILHMKKEYQHLKFQMFDIQRKLVSQQGKECAEVFLYYVVYMYSYSIKIKQLHFIAENMQWLHIDLKEESFGVL